MAIQPTGDNLLIATLQNMQKSQNEQLIQIARLVGLTTNSTSKAQVMELMELSPEDRNNLLTQIDKTLAQIKASSNLPAVQQQIEALEQQKNLLQQNLVKLALLQINNKTFPVYSTYDLKAGQEISLKFVPNIGLQLLAITENDEQITIQTKIEQIISQNLRQLLPLQKPDNFFTSLNVINQLIKQIPLAQLNQLIDKPMQDVLEKLNQTIPDLQKLVDPKILKIIIEKSGIQFERQLIASLTNTKLTNEKLPVTETAESNISGKTGIPLKTETPLVKQETSFVQGQRLTPQNLAPLLTNINPVKNFIQADKPIVNPEATPVLQINKPINLDEAATIDKSLLNSLLNKPAHKTIERAPQTIPNPGQITSPSQTTSPASLSNTTKMANAENLQTLGQATSNKNPAVENQSAGKQRDLKGALVELVAKTQESIADEKLDVETQSRLQQTHLKDFIAQLLPFLTGKNQQKDLSMKALRTQLIALIQQHAYQAVSKIQIQQLQSLQPQSATQSDNTQQSWQIEIPIRYQQDIHPLQIQIEKRNLEDKESSGNKKKEQIKQWKIMMNFDLPVVGHFYAQLIWLNQQLSATLWAEKTETLQAAKEKMENLRTKLQEEGIIVTQLECLPGAPHRPQNQVNYSLIDITT